MKQIIQDLKSGKTLLEEVPVPVVKPGEVLIKTHRSLVSLGTERMLVEFGKANYLQKAKQQPEKVKMVIDKIKSDGLKPTLEAVFRKLGEPLPLGYCNAGEIVAIGHGVDEFMIGDRVASNGKHAEVVSVPKNLVVKIPDNISYDQAAFTVIGSIALQGIRNLNPAFGETVIVTGLGLIGLIAAQLLKANGCNVIGFDFDRSKIDLAKSFGIQAYNSGESDPVQTVMNKTGQTGADGVLITASTSSNEVISQAAKMSRKKGKIVLVGVIGLDIKRSDFYEKELTFQVSSSYGPGRYDPVYEEQGMDYPVAYVRWTEKRNFGAILHAIAEKQLNVDPLISEMVDLNDFEKIYNNISGSKSIASLLKYQADINIDNTKITFDTKRKFSSKSDVIGIIGAGNYTNSMILPKLRSLNANIKYIASASGLSSTLAAKKYNITNATTNIDDILEDEDVSLVMITTRHNLHAEQVIKALKADKHVFVEKPLALTYQELNEIDKIYRNSNRTLTVGFNRRFSPFALDLKNKLGDNPDVMNVIATMNAGYIPPEMWVNDMKQGGGRIIGEACHLIDLMTFFTGSLVESVFMNALGNSPKDNTDNAIIVLRYKNGSQGVINYFSNGSKKYSKERIEVYSNNRTAIIDNFRRIKYYGFKGKGFKKSQDKGQAKQFELLLKSLRKGDKAIIPSDQIFNTSKAAIAAIESMKTGNRIKIN
ncbi:MAG TPA: dehydrogenase [Bacteroidetes bacterium]|nr:dehydrogenase [Bacteroidota bacterium]